MSKAILLSIHPEWAEKIYSGEKTIEWRVIEIEAHLTWFGWLNFIFNRSNAITQDTCYREIVK